jgi:hypothetical protein
VSDQVEGETHAGQEAPRAWDDEEAAAFAARVERRLDLPLQAEGWGAQRLVADAVDLFAAGRELAATIAGRALPRWETKERDKETIPERVRIGIQKYFQKPFHLWNVERIVDVTPFQLVHQPPWRVGQAAALTEEQRPPRTFEKATRALVKLVDEARAWKAYDRTALEARKRLLVDPLPYGKEDDAPAADAAPQGRSVLIDIAGPGGPGALPSWFDPRRLRGPTPRGGPGPAPGGFEMTQPEDEPPPRRPPPAMGPGGFDMSQPDD